VTGRYGVMGRRTFVNITGVLEKYVVEMPEKVNI
jgi:hypothetical protein